MSSIVTRDETGCFQCDPLVSAIARNGTVEKLRNRKSKYGQEPNQDYSVQCFLWFQRNYSRRTQAEGQTVHVGYYLDVLNRLLSRMLRVRPEYREQGILVFVARQCTGMENKTVLDYLVKKSINSIPSSLVSAWYGYEEFLTLKLAMKGNGLDHTIPDIQKASTAILEKNSEERVASNAVYSLKYVLSKKESKL